MEKNKNKKAEKTIFKLKQEIELLKKSCNKKLSYYSLSKPNKINFKNNKFRSNSCREFNGFNSNFNCSINFENKENDYFKNSNDIIPFKNNDEIGKNNLSVKQNRLFTLSEEISSQGNRSNNFENNCIDNKIIYNQNLFYKIKGNDMDSKSNSNN